MIITPEVFWIAYSLGSRNASGERDELMALLKQRCSHGEERLEAIGQNVRALQALLVLNVERAPGMDLPEAIGSGRIGLLEVVEAILGARPAPLAQGPTASERPTSWRSGLVASRAARATSRLRSRRSRGWTLRPHGYESALPGEAIRHQSQATRWCAQR